MMFISLPALTLAMAISGQLTPGDTLPRLKGEFLNGHEATLPDHAKGKVALVALGFSYDSRIAVEDWVRRFRKEYGARPGVTFYQVPLIGGMARMGRWFIDSGMRKGTPKDDYEHVITVYGNTEPWKERVRFTDAKFAYLILIDVDGHVAWMHAGKYDDQAFTQLDGVMRRLLATAK